MKIRSSTIIGVVIGLFIAAITVLLASFNTKWDNEAVQSIVNFIAGVPALLFATKLKMPPPLQNISFFIYWMLAGAAFGWLTGRKGIRSKIQITMLAVGLIIVHRVVQVRLEKELAGALKALGEALGGIFIK